MEKGGGVGTQGLVGSGSAEGFFVVGMDRKAKKKPTTKKHCAPKVDQFKAGKLRKKSY